MGGEEKDYIRYKGVVRKRNTTSQDTFIPDAHCLTIKKQKCWRGAPAIGVNCSTSTFHFQMNFS